MPYVPGNAVPGYSDARNFYLTHPREYVTAPGGAFDEGGTRQVLDPSPRLNPDYAEPVAPIPHGMVGETPDSLPPQPPPPPPPPPPGESAGRAYGKFRKISSRGGPEVQPSNSAILLQKAAARRLGLE